MAAFVTKIYIKSNTGELTELGALSNIPSENFQKITFSYTPPDGTTYCTLCLIGQDATPSSGDHLFIDNIQVEYDIKDNQIAMPWQPGNADLEKIRIMPRIFGTLALASGIVSDGELFFVTDDAAYIGTEIPNCYWNITTGEGACA